MELRKDYILDRWVIIATGRGKRPEQFRTEDEIYANDQGPEKCFFCPGHEDLTPPEIGRTKGDHGSWNMRWFANKFAAVDKKGDPKIKTTDRFFTYADAYGVHSVIVETPEHSKQMIDLSEDELMELLRVYANRIADRLNEPDIKYVAVFKNEGPKAGTSIVHSHSQLISLNIVPPTVREKLDAVKKHPSCPYCDIIKIENKSLRHVHEDDTTVTFTPYASRFNFEVWIVPKSHYRTLMDFSDDELFDLASALKRVLRKLKELNANFNMAIYYAPKGEDLHFHIEILPRIATWAGFELETGIIINVVSPEDAANFYRGEHKQG
ncbi:galactose-1-phosphate uridylyltransferase [Candidatus Woesearchaeota archaeon]|nr:galactose-1-phosphate uridylyltransferase [Candidatus Woesearchaeota archaeon]